LNSFAALAVTIAIVSACRNAASHGTGRSADPIPATGEGSEIVIHDYRNGLAGVHAANPAIRLRLIRDSTRLGDSLLVVEYPPPTGDPAALDLRLAGRFHFS
jgi:hypothetical protein